MLLKIPAKGVNLLFLVNTLFVFQVFSQTTSLSFTSIPVADPDLNAPGRGVEQWHDRNDVNVPIEGTNTPRLDIYFRFVWTRIEGPTLGSYTWNYFDSLVNYAIVRKQKMSFGIMQLYPGGAVQDGLVSFDGGLASYPLYLHALMQSETVKDWRTGTVWTPNYNSTNYQNRLLALHQAIDAHIKSTSFNGVPYQNVISCIDIRGYGAWGEWHSGYTINNLVSDYPAGTFPTVASLKKIVDAHTQGFPDFPLVAMIAAFDANWLQNTMNPPEIAYYVLTQRNNWGLIGWRRDQWGATDSYISSYLDNNTRTFGGLVFKDSIMVRWKSAPITGEPPGWNPNGFADLERQVALYHAASFGNGNYGVTPTTTIKTRVRGASKLCGYRLILEGGSLTLNGNNLTVALNWKNIGQAPTYENWNVEFELKNSNNQTVWSGQSQFKPKRFLPSSTATVVTDNFTSLPAGTFNLNIIIKDPNGYRDPLPLAITGRNTDGSYPVKQQITIQSLVPPPNIAVANNCGSSVLTASGYTGTLLWSTGENTPSITVTAPGLYTVAQTVGGVTSAFGSATAAPKAIPTAPGIAVVNNCGSSLLSAAGVSGATFSWSTGETTNSITVQNGTYTVTQTANGCTSPSANATAVPKSIPSAPGVSVTDNCGNSLLTATGSAGAAYSWSTGQTTQSITVASNSTYTVTQTINNCTSPIGSANAAPKPVPTLSSSLTAAATSGALFNYTPASGTGATTFSWSRAAVASISNLAANGNGSINETLVNTTASPVIVTYVYTLTAGGCTNTQNLVVTVGVDGSIVSPLVTTQPASQTKCAGDNITFNSGAGGSPAPTVQWQESTNGNSWHDINGAINATLSFTSATADNNNQYRAVWTNIAGSVISNVAILTVNSIPLTPSVSVTDNCASSVLTATGAAEASFSWNTGAATNSITVTTGGIYTVTQTVNGCTGPAGNGTAAPKPIPAAPDISVDNNCGSSLLTAAGVPGAAFSWNTGATTGAITVTSGGTYTVTQTVNNCISPFANITAAPKPIPTLSSSLTAAATSGASFNYTPASSTGGTAFSWSRAAVSGVSNAADNGNGSINETLVNTTGSPVNVTYVYTLTANGCTNAQNVVVTVGVDGSIIAPAITTHPSTQTKCAGEDVTFSSGADGSPAPTVQWQENTNGTSWNNIAGATSSTLSFTTTTADNNKQYRALWTNMAGNVSSNTATLSVNAIPSAPSVSVANNCGSSLLTANGASGATYSWNTGETTNAITVQGGTYTVIQTLNGCTSPSGSGTATPKSIPSAPGVSVENNCGSSVLTATGDPGATFSWSTGETTGAITVTTNNTYTVTQTVNNCTSPSGSGVAAPKPMATLSTGLTASATSNSAFNYTPGSSTVGTTFAWSRAAVSGISNAADNGNGSINETLVNTTALPVTVTYVFTLTANGCINTQNVIVTVGVDGSIVAPSITTQPTSQTKCSGENITFNSGASGSPAPTVQWQENNGGSWNNITGATGSTLSFTTTTADNNKQYRAVWTNMAGSVNSNAATLAVNSIPSAPSVSVTDNCASSLLTASGTTGASFLWSTTATTSSITVNTAGTFTVTQTVNGCTSPSGSGVAAPKPIPVLSSSLTGTATSSATFNYTPASTVTGTTFTWSRAAVAGISNAAGSGNGNISETLVNISGSPVNVTYVYSLTANGCINSQNVVVSVGVDGSIVSPLVTTQPASQARCAGANASFSSVASGSPAPTIQWQESTNGTSWNNITGATNSTLSFTTTTADNNKQYHAVWTNVAGTVISSGATLTVNSIPSAPSVSVTNNCSNSLLAATGANGATFAWNTGATTSSINVTAAGTYTVTQTLNGCTSPSGNGLAAPKPTPVLSSSLTGTATSGTAFTYTATSSTTGTTFAWTRAAVTGISNAAGNGTGNINEILVNTTASPVSVTYVYTLTASGCINTQNVVVTVNANFVSPAVTTQPASQSRCAGSNASFSSAASGSPAPAVQWQVNTSGTWSNITGATTSTLTFATNAADNNKQYRAVWTNIGGSVNSNAATLTVNSIPSAPSVSVTNNCGNALLSATGSTGATFSWNTGATTNSITVTTAGTYTVTQTVTGCTSTAGSGIAAPRTIPVLSSSLTANATTGTTFNYTATSSTTGTTFAWTRAAVTGISNAAASGTGNVSEALINTTASAVNVTYVYTLTANGCTNTQNLVVTVSATSSAPVVTTQPSAQARCAGSSASFTSAASGSPAPTVQWQVSTNGGFSYSNITGATSATLTFATATTDNNKRYRARWTNSAGAVNSSSALLTVNSVPSAPTISVTNNCGNSVLTATGTGSLLWSTGATTSSITVTTAGTYTVTRTVNTCTSPAASAVAAPRVLPVLSSNLAGAVTTGNPFTYTATSVTTGTTFAWSRAAVTGISNSAATGTGNISETLINTTDAPINVAYVYTLTANGCTNTQNLVVTVNPIYCVINGAITSSFNSSSIPAGRFIWFSSVLSRGSFTGVNGTVSFNITNSVITFTANSQQYTLNVPNSRIRFDSTVTSATTQFINNAWETVVPKSYTDFAFMGGLSYQVPTSLPGNITNVRWSATITINKSGIRPTWKWAAAVYTSFAAHSGLNIKPKNGSTQNPYPNNDLAGTPENFKTSLVSGAKGTGGTNYTGSYSSTSTVTCAVSVGQRPIETEGAEQLIVKEIPKIPIEALGGEGLKVAVLPNPTSSSFNLLINGKRKGLASVKVIDISGRVVERHEKIPPNGLFRLGQRLAAGSYFIEVVQEDQKQIIRVIKVN